MIAIASSYLNWFVFVSVVLGLAGTFDVLSQPGRAFDAAGHRKLVWLSIEAAGTIVLGGLFTWAVYSLMIRPGVVRAGGRHRIKGRVTFAVLSGLVRVIFGGLGGAIRGFLMPRSSSGRTRHTESTNPAGAPRQPAPVKRPCPTCSGLFGRCADCRGSGAISGNVCRRCNGSGHSTCPTCGGRGYLA